MFRTNSLEIAAYLATDEDTGYKGIDRETLDFLFRNQTLVKRKLQAYHAGTALVEPRLLHTKYKELKAKVFDLKRGLIQPE